MNFKRHLDFAVLKKDFYASYSYWVWAGNRMHTEPNWWISVNDRGTILSSNDVTRERQAVLPLNWLLCSVIECN